MADGATPTAAEGGDFLALIQDGIAARAAGDLERAAARFRAACDLRPGDVGARCELAFTLLTARDDEGAAALAAEVLTQAPDNFSALTTLAFAERRLGRLEAAQARLARALQVAPDRVEVALERVALLEELGRPREALAAVFEILAHDPDHPAHLLRMARLQQKAGSAAGAVVFAALAARRAEEAPDLRLDAVRLLVELGRRGEAERTLRAAILAQPTFAAAHVELAGLQAAGGAPRRAELTIEAGIEAAPHDAGLWAAAARLRAERGDEASALDAWGRLLGIDPDHGEALRARAAAARRAGRRGEAVASLARLAARAPDARDTLLELARESRAAGEPAVALQALDALAEAAAETPGLRLERGLARRDAHDHAGALADFLALREADPARGALEAATEHQALGAPEPARALLAEAAGGEGTLAVQAAVRLAALDRLAGRPQAAAERLAALRAAGHATVEMALEEALALADLGEVERAREALGQDLSPPVLALRLFLAARQGEGLAVDALAWEAAPVAARDAVLWAARAEALAAVHGPAAADLAGPAPPPADAWARGRLHLAQARLAWAAWRLEEAKAACAAAVEAFPEEMEAHETLARLAILQGRPEEASAWLARFLELDRAGRIMRSEPLAPTQTLHGQLINELRLDPALQTQLGRIAGSEPEARALALAEVLQARPECTPAALQRLLALRQARALVPRAVPARSIPRQIVQVWLGDEPPPAVAEAMEGWRTGHPRFACRVFDRAGAAHFLGRRAGERALEAWRLAGDERAARLFQWVWLAHEGGWFVDPRLVRRGDLGPLGDGAGLVAVQGKFAELDADLVGAVASHPALIAAADEATAAILRGDSDIPWLGLGPGLLSRAVAAKAPNDVEILEPNKGFALFGRLQPSRV